VRRWAYPALAFLTGAAVTIFEFAAPSLFRAYFGQTIYVWGNVIGVILAALSLGYALGGRWADRTRGLLPLACVIGFAAVYGLLIGWLGPSVSSWLAGPEEYTQSSALRSFIGESLAASLLLFGPPLVALGMATPLLVKRAATDRPVGQAAGLIFGVGTAGSIAGIYLTIYGLIPWIGVRDAIRISAGLLLLAGLACLWLERRRRFAGGGLLLLGLGLLGGRTAWADLPPAGSKLVLAIESPYQLVRVVDRPPGPEGWRQRWLAFDEGMGSYHSMEVDRRTGWTGAYYDAFVTLPEWVGGKRPTKICILGNAAGTMCRLLRLHHDPHALILHGVEIDPAVTRAAQEAMDLPEPEPPYLVYFQADGRTFLEGTPPGSYDAIILDAYARQVSIPAALASREFFALAKSRLRPGGLFLANLGALRPGSRLVRVLCNTLAAGFGTPVYRAPLQDQFNVLLVAMRGGAPPPPPPATRFQAALSFGRHAPGGLVLTDDFCPVERLTALDLLLE